MAERETRTSPNRSPRSRRVSSRAIRELAREIAERFRPDRIILFGSYAYGTPHADSDVDLLVIMPARNMIDQAVKIRRATSHPFPLDLIVRTPEVMKQRIEDGDWFLREIAGKGIVLYEATDEGVDREGRVRLAGSTNPHPDIDSSEAPP
ncbi:MAG: nucleotidyltransferase domain-containing protein [Isosphaeraceae bacterium]